VTPRRLTTILAKQPAPGAVKTRLCPPLTPAQAAELATAMLDDTVGKCRGSTQFESALCVAPDEAIPWFRARFPDVGEITAQVGEGLGARLADCFERAARLHLGWTLACIGTDAPQVPLERIVEAHRELESGADLVLGPDEGGGYYLVALRRPIPELFTRVPMSTPDMCARTLELARSLALRVHLLDPDYDVDTPADLMRLASGPSALRTARFASAVLVRSERSEAT
jgi:rSAM/selenodomain-associated transferase 1